MGEVKELKEDLGKTKSLSEEAKQVQEPQVDQSKLAYGDLERIANELHNQNRALHERIQELQLDGMFKRLDYLFRVVDIEHSTAFEPVFSEDFTKSCVEEIEAMMTLDQPEGDAPGQ